MDKKVTIVDARMGRGKSSAAIRYMNENKDTMKFLYVTPFLSEVGRVCDQCDFEQPTDDFTTKSNELKSKLRQGRNVAATHSLFYLLDEKALDLVREKHYTLIVDESISVVGKVVVTPSDIDIITGYMANENESGKLTWRNPEYTGGFIHYKELADAGILFHCGSTLMTIIDPQLLKAFDHVFMLTYLFSGQCEKAYLDFFHFGYDIIGVETDEEGFYFSDKPDNPPPMNYSQLIRIWDNKKANSPGDGRTALSASWFIKHGYSSPELVTLRKGMKNFFDCVADAKSQDRLWTSFKETKERLIDKGRGRYRKNFLQIAARATNEYSNCTAVAYLANRFVDPSVKAFFNSGGCSIDEDKFALAEMLQWIWRSAIRDDRPIDLYIPSQRMRNLLTDWIETVSEGGAYPK